MYLGWVVMRVSVCDLPLLEPQWGHHHLFGGRTLSEQVLRTGHYEFSDHTCETSTWAKEQLN